MAAPDDLPDTASKLRRTWTVSLQEGVTPTFQMTLGGTFGNGPDGQQKLTAGVNNVYRNGDSLSIFGWSTTDLKSTTTNWQSGMTYSVPLVRKVTQSLTVSGSIQRWVLPAVKTGAMDWVAAGSLAYATKIRRLPLYVAEDSYSLLRSTLPKGSLLYSQIFTQHQLVKRENFSMALRHGPQYTYSWGFYGAEGNRVVRYTGSLVMRYRGTTFEAGYRQQFGLQDKIPYNHYWCFLVTRQITRPFSTRN